MNTTKIILIGLFTLSCHASDFYPLMAEQPQSPEAISASIATGSALYIRHLEAPNPLTSVMGMIVTYRKGTAEAAGQSGASFGGSPEWKRKLAISIAVRMHDMPTPNRLPDQNRMDRFVPGTGSTYIGMSFLSYLPDGKGHSGSGTQQIIQHSEIDMTKMAGPLDASKLPFILDTLLMREQQATPVFVWLPQSFDLKQSPKKIGGADLPDGTVIVYAVVK